ncbi:MAG: SRPBCC domain-containing protein [Bacteroidota bacterium]
MYIILGLGIFVLLLVLTGRKSVHQEILVQASPAEVWEVLLDTHKYPDWNPVMKVIEGEIKPGQRVKYLFIQPPGDPLEIESVISQMLPNQLLNQKGGSPFLLSFDHQYILEGKETSQVLIHEEYRGLLVHFWNSASVEKAYARLLNALKKRTESLSSKAYERNH